MNYVRYVDEYKTTFSLNNSASIRISFNKLRENNHKISDDNESIIKIEDFLSTGTHFPYKYFLQLNKENQKLVVEAELGDSEKQLIVAQNLIQSKHDFPFNTKIGIDFLRMSINNGNKKSLIYYIKMIVKGNIIPKNLKKVKKLLETSFSDDKSTYFYLYGKLFKKAEKYFQQSLNNCDSLYEYAEMYRKGYLQINRGIDISKYYKQSIKLGNINSLFKYGLYLISFGDKEKQEEGNQLIKDSLSKGCIKALYYYGTKLEKEIDEDQKDNQSKEIEMINIFKLAAYEGYDKSINKYGIKLIQYNNKSMKGENYDESIKYLQLGSDKGFVDSMFELGQYYADTNIPNPINAKAGERYVRISAESGYADAIGYYGSILLLGIGVEADIDRAITYYKTAISKGSAVAMNDYAYLLEEGKFVETNYKEAIKYYKMAIEKGETAAMNNYARMLEDGIGVEVDYQEAIKYYKMAIDKGESFSMYNYARMLEDGKGVEVDYQEAIKYHKMAIDKGDPDAMYYYASMLENGKGVEVDYQEAIKYYRIKKVFKKLIHFHSKSPAL